MNKILITINENLKVLKTVHSFILIIALSLVTLNSFSAPNTEVNYKRLGIDNNLSNNFVTSIVEGKLGAMWFATEDGLNQFNLTDIRQYNKYNSKIIGNELNCIIADTQDPLIWIGSQYHGLGCYNYITDTFVSYTSSKDDLNSISTDDITYLKQDIEGNIWISSYRYGLNYYNKETKTFTHYNSNTVESFPIEAIYSFDIGRDGNIYLGYYNEGLIILNPKTKEIKKFRHNRNDNRSLPGDQVKCVYSDKLGQIWIGTNNGLALYNPANEDFKVFRHDKDQPQSLPNNVVYSILHGAGNKLYVATEFNGVSQMNLDMLSLNSEGEFLRAFDINDINESTVRSMCEDKFGNFWVATYGNGVYFISGVEKQFRSLTYPNQLSSKIAWGICFDKENNLWAGTDGSGIDIIKNSVHTKNYSRELSDKSVLSTMCDSDGNIWIGTFYGGVNVYDSSKGVFEHLKVNEESLDIRCFYDDIVHGNVWIGTESGVVVINKNNKNIVQRLTGDNGLPEELIRAIHLDLDGRIWIGTFGKGIALYNSDSELISLINISNYLKSNSINQIYGGSNGAIWIATGVGLVKFDRGATKPSKIYTLKDGLENDCIRAIIEDDKKNIWFSTNKSIGCLTIASDKLNNYNHKNGVIPGNFMSGSVSKSTDGSIYFGSSEGICYFAPSKVLQQLQPPAATVITELRIHEGMSVDMVVKYPTNLEKHTVELGYRQNNFTLLFGSPNFTHALDTEYSYRLVGLSDEWYMVNSANKITFRHLQPGKYTFEIRSRFRNQHWIADITSIKIVISPHFLLSNTAKTIYYLLIIIAIWFFLWMYRHKLEKESLLKIENEKILQLQDINDERLRFYTNITHELRTPLTLILGPLEDIMQDNKISPYISKKINIIYKSATQLLNLINQLLEFRKTETLNKKLSPKYADLSQRIYAIGDVFKESNTNKNLTISIDIKPEVKLHFDSDAIYIIVNNLLSNATKYTSSGEVVLSLTESQEGGMNYAMISVKDTGCGISKESIKHIFERYYQPKDRLQVSGTGIGLALVKNLITLHEASISVDSTQGVGTTFHVKLDMKNTYGLNINNETNNISESSDIEDGDTPEIILVVEDNISICEYISDSLSGQYKVIIANDGQQGKKLAQEQIPDIIISDVMMPIMDGIEMCEILKSDVRTSHIPIILLTAKSSSENRAKGYNIGADSYITKPFSTSMLISRVRNLLESRKKIATMLLSPQISISERNKVESTLQPMDNSFLKRVTNHIEENLSTEKIDIAFIADNMHMSHSTLYRKMKALVNMSTQEYVRKIRLRRAAEMLLNEEYNISEVTWKVGFSSPAYFRQCFKEEYGVSPSVYKEHKQGSIILPLL